MRRSRGCCLSTAVMYSCFFFFSSRRPHTRWTGDWSSDVCSSDLALFIAGAILLVLFVLWDRAQEQPLVPHTLFSDRNFSVGNGLAAIVSFGMMGLFLPLTIFLQSVLGFSALKAGLTLAPMPLTSMFVAPLSGRATDRVGGKYILMFGLTCFAAGMG